MIRNGIGDKTEQCIWEVERERTSVSSAGLG